jgi:hypothetical protein
MLGVDASFLHIWGRFWNHMPICGPAPAAKEGCFAPGGSLGVRCDRPHSAGPKPAVPALSPGIPDETG